MLKLAMFLGILFIVMGVGILVAAKRLLLEAPVTADDTTWAACLDQLRGSPDTVLDVHGTVELL